VLQELYERFTGGTMNLKDKAKKAMESGNMKIVSEKKEPHKFRHAVDVYKDDKGLYILTVIKYDENLNVHSTSSKVLADNKVSALRKSHNIVADKIIQSIDLSEEYTYDK
jgi:hypothetical protein